MLRHVWSGFKCLQIESNGDLLCIQWDFRHYVTGGEFLEQLIDYELLKTDFSQFTSQALMSLALRLQTILQLVTETWTTVLVLLTGNSANLIHLSLVPNYKLRVASIEINHRYLKIRHSHSHWHGVEWQSISARMQHLSVIGANSYVTEVNDFLMFWNQFQQRRFQKAIGDAVLVCLGNNLKSNK